MKWLFKRCREPDQRDRELFEAQIKADVDHKVAQKQLDAAHRLAGELHQIRKRNHFGHSLQSLYDGKKP